MNRRTTFGTLVLATCGCAGAYAQPQQADLSKPTVPLVSAIGCALRMPDGAWMLTNATDASSPGRSEVRMTERSSLSGFASATVSPGTRARATSAADTKE